VIEFTTKIQRKRRFFMESIATGIFQHLNTSPAHPPFLAK
jgi:hypothetical protein